MTENKERLWILEDDTGAQFVYTEILGGKYELDQFSTVGEFRKALENSKDRPELVIADLRLPDESFLTFLTSQEGQSLRSLKFMVISSVDDLEALRQCFNMGAVDYLTKPFNKGELVYKVDKALGDGTGLPPDKVHVDLGSLTVSHNGVTSEPLTAKELQIFTIMRDSTGTVTRDDIVRRVWGEIRVDTKSFDVHLFNLRKKLGPIGMEIKNVSPGSYLLSRDGVDVAS